MQIALFAAILLIAISVPTAYAATLQLVTENGNVFSIDFDEILNTWKLIGGNSTAPVSLNSTIQQDIQRLVNNAVTNSTTQQEIKELEDKLENIFNQLNSNSTSTANTINDLQNQINDLLSDTSTDDEINRLQDLINRLTQSTNSTATELNEALTELETLLEDSVAELEAGTGVGAGALGSSGRLESIPTTGSTVTGTHTHYDTRGTISPSTAYFYLEDDFDWATLILENEVYDEEYEVPKLGAEYRANSGTQTLQETRSSPQSVELNVRGLTPHTAWALIQNDGTDTASYAGVTNSAGEVLIPRTPNDGVTITRGASFESSPNLEILDLKTVKDVITVDDWGTMNDMHVTVTRIGSFSAVLVSPIGDLYPLLNGRSVTGSNSIEYIVDTIGEEMHGDWVLRFTSIYYTGATLLNWSISINHGGDYSMIESVSGSGRQYNVEVSPISSYGTYNLDLLNTTGIGTARTTGVYPLDRTRDSGPDETHAVGGAELCPGDDLYVCLVENYNRDTWYKRSPLQFLVTFNKPVVNVDTRDFNILRCGSGSSTCDPIITAQNTALDVWHNSEQSVPNTSSISQRYSYTYPSVKLIINASSPNDRNVDHWKLNLTAPNGNTIVITDGSTTTLDSSGGIHEFYLGELADVNTGRGNWVLSVIDETYDDDPTTYYGDEPEGQINSWSIVRDVGSSSSKLTVSRVTPQGTEGDQYLVDIHRTHRRGVSGTFTLWLDNTNDIESTSGETLNPRIEFGSNHHSVFHYSRYQPTALTSIIVTNSTYDSVTFQVGFGASVVGVNKTDFIVLENGVPDYSGSQVSTYTSAPNISVRGTADYGTYDTILVNNQREGVVNNMTLNIDISHPRIGDLEVELVGPDGTTQMIHNNAGGNTVDLVSSFTPGFTNTEINGNWTLQIHDTVRHNTIGTLNSWSLDFSYEEPPTFDELASIERDKGEAYTWKDFLPGKYSLRIYQDAPINNYCSGILFDAYNKESFCLPERNDKIATYNGNFHKPSRVDNYNHTLPVTENLQVSKISLSIDSDRNLVGVDKFTLTSPTGEVIVDMDYSIERFESGTTFQKDYHLESKIPINGNWKLHFDDYYGYNINWSIKFGEGSLIYTSNAYMRYPMTVPVNISNVGASNTDCDSNVISLNYLDNRYEAGDIMMVPIVPKMSVLCMSIERINTVIHLADVSPQVQLAVIPPISSSNGVATSGASFFATKTGNVNALFDVTANMGLDIRRTLDFTDRYNAYPRNVVTYEKSIWGSKISDATSSSSTISTSINIYRNGIHVANEKIINKNLIPMQIISSNVIPFRADQHIISNSNNLSINPVLAFYVESGDFVQITISTRTTGGVELPSSTSKAKVWSCRIEANTGTGGHQHPDKVIIIGVGPTAPNQCPGSLSSHTPQFLERPVPSIIVEYTGKSWTKINGGYVIFTGS